MENYNPKDTEEGKKPDETGVAEVSKKRRKKVSKKIPLPVKKETGEKKTEQTAKPAEEQPAKEKEEKESLVLPEINKEKAEEESEFLGELVIDHEEMDDQLLEEPEQLEEIQPTDPEDTNESEPLVILEDTPDLEAPVDIFAELEPESAEPAKPETPFLFNLPPVEVNRQEFMNQTPLDNVPETQGMIDPSQWSSINFNVDRPAITTENVIPEDEAKNMAYRAEKRGLSRGVVSGGLVGWWLGRRNKNAMRRELDEELEQQNEIISGMRSEKVSAEESYKKYINGIKRRQEELVDSLKRYKAEKQVQDKEREALRATPPSWEQQYAASNPQTDSRLETSNSQDTKQQPEQKVETKEQLQNEADPNIAPEGRRYDASAWHRIEVDERTGRASETPSNEYGKAFVQERQQERLAHSAAKVQTASKLGSTLMGADGGGGSPVRTPAPQSKIVTQVTKLGLVFKDTEYIRTQLAANMTSPQLWLISAVIVVLLLLSGAI